VDERTLETSPAGRRKGEEFPAGRASPEAEEVRGRMGEWDSERSLRHMIQVLRGAILNATIDPDSAEGAELREMAKTLKNWANLAA